MTDTATVNERAAGPLPHQQRVDDVVASLGTVSLSAGDWVRCTVVGSSVLWLRELSKLFARVRG